MLRLYARCLFSESLPVLEQIADETSELYQRRNLRKRKKNQKSHFFSTSLTVLESQGIISNILDHRNRVSAFHNFSFSIIVPLFVTFHEERVMKIRTVFSSLLQTLPLTDKLIGFLRSVNVPERFHNPAVVLSYSLFQVLSIRWSHGRRKMSVIDIGRQTLLIGLLHVLSRRLATAVQGYLFFVPDWMISTYIAFKTAAFIQRLVRFGVLDSLEWLVEGFLHTFTFLEKKLDDLPPGYPVPQSLTCMICREMVKDPVELLGYFFCGPCLEKWFSEGKLVHPCTNEAVSKEVMAHSIVLHRIARKYRASALKALARQADTQT
jgi:hypothetical protein